MKTGLSSALGVSILLGISVVESAADGLDAMGSEAAAVCACDSGWSEFSAGAGGMSAAFTGTVNNAEVSSIPVPSDRDGIAERTGFDTWRHQHFSNEELADPDISSALADQLVDYEVD